MAEPTSAVLEALALEVFQITKITWLLLQRSRGEAGYDLTEAEFLTLDALQQHPVLTVGDLQRRVQVLPAQMSRIIKSLETKYEAPLVTCNINTDDKRKIDVRITPAGDAAANSFRRSKIATYLDALRTLPPEDQTELQRIVHKMRQAMEA